MNISRLLFKVKSTTTPSIDKTHLNSTDQNKMRKIKRLMEKSKRLPIQNGGFQSNWRRHFCPRVLVASNIDFLPLLNQPKNYFTFEQQQDGSEYMEVEIAYKQKPR